MVGQGDIEDSGSLSVAVLSMNFRISRGIRPFLMKTIVGSQARLQPRDELQVAQHPSGRPTEKLAPGSCKVI